MPKLAGAMTLAVIFIAVAGLGQTASAGVDNSAPPGIVATTAKLSDILAAHVKAIGKAIDPDAPVAEAGTIQESGLSGTYSDIGAGGDYISTHVLGPVTTRSGRRGGTSWWQDENGQVIRQETIHHRSEIDARALDQAMTSTANGVKLLGEVTAPVPAYVVEVNPPDGRRMWIYYDKHTNLIVRTESIYPHYRVVNTYASFKTSNGRSAPWTGTYSDGDAKNDESWAITSLRYGGPVDPASLEIPASRTLVTFPAGSLEVKLPSRISDSRIILTLTINGKGYDFLLDSGSSEINVDFAAAKDMGLPLYGKNSSYAVGSFDQSESVIPDVSIGDLKMHNVVVNVLPFTENPDDKTKIVGLVGYDFIASAVIRVDYDHHSVSALPTGTYVPSADTRAVPVNLDDRVPIAAAQIGGVTADHLILDTGANEGFIFPGFAAKHKDAIADEGGGNRMAENSPFMYASGVGGNVSLKATEIRSFNFAGVNFTDWILYVQQGNGLDYEDYDGLIGYDFLKYFSVVFDYRNSVIYLEPNDTFRRSTSRS
jgi:hypothetical protein